MDKFIKDNIFAALDRVIIKFFAFGIEKPADLGPDAKFIILHEVMTELKKLDTCPYLITSKFFSLHLFSTTFTRSEPSKSL